jgi:hypothetical protein
MLYIGVTLHYIILHAYIHFADPTFVPRQLNMKQATNIQDKIYSIYKRTHEYVKEHQIIQKQLI